jgi:hypothetical protein
MKIYAYTNICIYVLRNIHRLIFIDIFIYIYTSMTHISTGLQSFPFVNAPFEIKIFLLDGDSLKCGDEVPLLMKFQYEGNGFEN